MKHLSCPVSGAVPKDENIWATTSFHLLCKENRIKGKYAKEVILKKKPWQYDQKQWFWLSIEPEVNNNSPTECEILTCAVKYVIQ